MPDPAKSLILCVHAHQPVGNFGWVFEEAYEKSYRPFFKALDKHPKVLVSCHFSGSLIDWLEVHRPELIRLLKKMADRGQLEFMGGGYYEPIYGAISKKDLAGQIELMRNKLKSLFGCHPEGAWLTERVWDPGLVNSLTKAGVHYTVLDDFHLEKAGISAPVTGFYQTKEGASVLDLFASMKDLRYLMPFHKAQETIDFIHKTEAGAEGVFVFADDLEKFGMWPGTHRWVYEEGWLDEMLRLLEQDKEIKLYTFSQFRRHFHAKRSVSVPHASYSEMMEWSGGSFYNFFDKYPESRYMRDRMWKISRDLDRLSAKNGSLAASEEARIALYRAQCNCSYWHGVFGGLYLHHLRSAVFENLIQAEEILTKLLDKSSKKNLTVIRPQKLETGERWQIRQKNLVTFFNPKYGASLEELDYLPKSVNLMCNIQRHKESYHEVVLKKASSSIDSPSAMPLSIHEMLGTKEKDLEKLLYYDPYKRLSLMDHFFQEEIGVEEFGRASYEERGDFVGAFYRLHPAAARTAKELHFERTGHLTLHGQRHLLRLRKIIAPKGASTVRAHYYLKNDSAKPIQFVFGVEFNFSIGDDYARKGLYEKNVKEWIFNDAWRGLRIQLNSNDAMTLIASPVETVSESESGLEKTYQELGILLQKSFELEAGETKEHVLELGVEPC